MIFDENLSTYALIVVCCGCLLVGPFGDRDDQQVFVQKVVPDTDRLFVRHSYSGKRFCPFTSVCKVMTSEHDKSTVHTLSLLFCIIIIVLLYVN